MSTILGIKSLVTLISENNDTAEYVYDISGLKQHMFDAEEVSKFVHNWLADKTNVKVSGMNVPPFEAFAVHPNVGYIEILNDEEQRFVHSFSFVDNILELRLPQYSMTRRYEAEGITAKIVIHDDGSECEYKITQKVNDDSVEEMWRDEDGNHILTKSWKVVDDVLTHQVTQFFEGEEIHSSFVYSLTAA